MAAPPLFMRLVVGGARKDLWMVPIDGTTKPWRLVGRWKMSEDRRFGEEVPSDDELHPKARWPLTATRGNFTRPPGTAMLPGLIVSGVMKLRRIWGGDGRG